MPQQALPDSYVGSAYVHAMLEGPRRPRDAKKNFAKTHPLLAWPRSKD